MFIDQARSVRVKAARAVPNGTLVYEPTETVTEWGLAHQLVVDLIREQGHDPRRYLHHFPHAEMHIAYPVCEFVKDDDDDDDPGEWVRVGTYVERYTLTHHGPRFVESPSEKDFTIAEAHDDPPSSPLEVRDPGNPDFTQGPSFSPVMPDLDMSRFDGDGVITPEHLRAAAADMAEDRGWLETGEAQIIAPEIGVYEAMHGTFYEQYGREIQIARAEWAAHAYPQNPVGYSTLEPDDSLFFVGLVFTDRDATSDPPSQSQRYETAEAPWRDGILSFSTTLGPADADSTDGWTSFPGPGRDNVYTRLDTYGGSVDLWPALTS